MGSRPLAHSGPAGGWALSKMAWWALLSAAVLLATLSGPGGATSGAAEAGGALAGAPFIGVDYSPYRDGQAPWGPAYPSREQIAEDMLIMARAGIRHVRIYSSGIHCTEDILREAQRRGIRVALGAWISAGNYGEVDAAIAYAKAYPRTVEMLVIGNETQPAWSTNKVPEDELIAQMQAARAQTGLPVTTGEHPDVWRDRRDTLGAAADLVWAQSFPYWNQACIEGALADLQGVYGQLLAAYPGKPVVIGETGWPAGGARNGCAQPGLANQAAFIGEMAHWARESGVTLYAFELADEAWKGEEASVERHWGLLRADRTPKPAWPLFLGAFTRAHLPAVMR